MSNSNLEGIDYPLAENRPDTVFGSRNKKLEQLSLDAVMTGDVSMEDLCITPRALKQQAQIARSVGRTELASNFERAAGMAVLPQEQIMRIYELLRPGRAETKDILLTEAKQLRNNFNAPLLAGFLEEAAELYDRRGLFQVRY